MSKKNISLASIVLCMILLVLFQYPIAISANNIEIDNPYKNVDFNTYGQFRTNLHTHTTNSNGIYDTDTIIKKYEGYNYDILGLSDHNWVTYPENYNGDMLVLSFNEIGHNLPEPKHHILSMFTDFYDFVGYKSGESKLIKPEGGYNDNYGESFGDENQILKNAVKFDGGKGRFIMCHPGVYTNLNDIYNKDFKYNIDWYTNIFRTYSSVLGIEIYNGNDSHEYARDLWDIMLSECLPERNIFAFSNDDNHGDCTGISFNTFLLPKKNELNLKSAMDNGEFFASSFGSNDFNELMKKSGLKNQDEYLWIPQILNIKVDKKNSEINITTDFCDKVEWISCYGEKIGEGNNINYINSGVNKYLRAVLTKTITLQNPNPTSKDNLYITYDVCKTYTQPFVIENKKTAKNGCSSELDNKNLISFCMFFFFCLFFTYKLKDGKNI